jgi:hypothetical protein
VSYIVLRGRWCNNIVWMCVHQVRVKLWFKRQFVWVFENTVLRRVFGPKGDEVTGEWRNLCNENLNDLYSPNIFRLIVSTRMRLAERVARLGRGEVYTGFWWGRLRNDTVWETQA